MQTMLLLDFGRPITYRVFQIKNADLISMEQIRNYEFLAFLTKNCELLRSEMQ